MRQHIGKALQSRSQAIRTALDRYNNAAIAAFPDKPRTLTWEEVVEYAFLADFDLLRDSREDVRERVWSTAAARLVMDQHYKLKRAAEEIVRLNIEIKRLVTYMRDEEEFLTQKEEEIQLTNPPLAHQVAIYRRERSRFTALHIKRLTALTELRGFSGSLDPGTRLQPPSVDGDTEMVDEAAGQDTPVDDCEMDADVTMDGEGDSDGDDDDDQLEEEQALSLMLDTILDLSED